MPRTVPADEWEVLMELMGAWSPELGGAAAAQEGEATHLTWTRKDDRRTVGEATLEPIFTWTNDGTRRVVWTSSRPEALRDVEKLPVPQSAGDVVELAYAIARTFGAVAVHSASRKVGFGQHAYALTSFRRTSDEPAEARAEKAMRFTEERLEEVSSRLINVVTRQGSGGARICSHAVTDLASLIAALAQYYANDLPIAADLEELVRKLDVWAVRAAIPTDEPLKVGAELAAEAKVWARR